MVRWILCCMLVTGSISCKKKTVEDEREALRRSRLKRARSRRARTHRKRSPAQPARRKVTRQPAQVEDPGLRPRVGITVHRPGSRPRQVIRYRLPQTFKETAVLEVKYTGSTMRSGPWRRKYRFLPTILYRTTLERALLRADGAVRYTYQGARNRVQPARGTPRETALAWEDDLERLESLAGWLEIGPTGVVRSLHNRVLQGSGDQNRLRLTSMALLLRFLHAVFPESPVGRGARWTVTMPAELNGYTFTQRYTYRLTKLEDRQGTLRISARSQVPPHLLRVRGCTAGRPIIVTSFRSTGSGTLRFDTRRLTPHYEGTLKATHRFRLGSRAKHQGLKASLAVRLRLKVYPDRPSP